MIEKSVYCPYISTKNYDWLKQLHKALLLVIRVTTMSSQKWLSIKYTYVNTPGSIK